MAQAQRETPVSGLTPTAAAKAAAVDVVPTRARYQYRRLGLFMAATDGLSVLVALLLAYLIRFGNIPIPGEFAAVMAVAPVVWVGVFHAIRLYAVQHLSPAEEFRRAVGAVTIGITLLVTGTFWLKAQSISRLWLGLTWLFAIVLVLLIRRGWRKAMAHMREDGRLAYRTLVVGTNEEGKTVFRTLLQPDLGFRPVGAVATSLSNGAGRLAAVGGDDEAATTLDVLGSVDDLESLVQDTATECLFVASSALTPSEMRLVTRTARTTGAEVRISSNLPEVLATRLTMQPIGGVMAMAMKPVRLTGGQAVVKRAFDLTASLLILALGLPIWLGIALAIALSSRGPVFFRQTRVGRHGETFEVLKFRTMIEGAESMIHELRSMNEADGPLFKLREDPRTTGVGRWLRRWSLDEIPQLLNVVRGDMSLVGPRPALPEEVKAWEDWHHQRLEVPPGISGLWQVNGRADLSFDDYVRLDLFYIENWSLTFDLYIIWKTIPALLSRKGAF
jgi:exopolysaccharide biosynthesis polyprenyl glycosylphosphotransferase